MKNKIVVIFLIILSIGISFYIYPKIFKKEKVEELVIIKPEDISRIKLDDAVRVRLSAYDSAKYGSISGGVSAISPDTVTSEDGTGTTYYSIEVKITSDMVLDNGTVVQLKPGMTATIDVLSGKSTVFEYIWAPMTRVQELALRD